MQTHFLKKNKVSYHPGDAIAWKCFDGKTMCGTVVDHWSGTYNVRRVDGGLCTPQVAVHAASLDEWDECIKSFTICKEK